MKFEQLLQPGQIAVNVAVLNKRRALEEITKRLTAGHPAFSAEAVLASLLGREKLGSTGLGHGVAIPHGRIAGLAETVGAFIRLEHAIDYDAHDGAPVDLIFGLLVPEKSTSEHLQNLAAVAEKLSDESFCARVRSAPDAAAVTALFAH
ncbi:MAG: PTS sugar transporter subunit IIA [Nevskiaceae bacterium]|nr:MAG: PTS sugar transporter subunit IIA [Nevskiaceae bacterium]TBR73340.1 MAG: PTS sugar transporter subunit IIA [Nevskiaceae bacterium]